MSIDSRQKTARWLTRLMLILLGIAAASAAFAWWTIGLSIDAADSFTPEPAVTSWTGVALITFGMSLIGIAVVKIMIKRNKRLVAPPSGEITGQKDKDTDEVLALNAARGIPFGLLFGIIFGITVLGNIGLGIALGMPLGVAVGVIYGALLNKKQP